MAILSCWAAKNSLRGTTPLFDNPNEQGWYRNFVPKKFRGKDSEWFPLFRRRKCSFRGIPRFNEEPIRNLGTEWNDMKKISFAKKPASANRIDGVFSSETCFGTKFRQDCNQKQSQVATNFFSTEWNSELVSPPRNGLDRIQSICFYFCSTTLRWYLQTFMDTWTSIPGIESI